MSVTITSTVRGGGLGNRMWVAKITGPHPEYGLARTFCRATKRLSGSGRSGSIIVTLSEPGYYEVSGQMHSERPISSGEEPRYFVQLTESGELVPVEREDVVAAVAEAVEG